jgi:hypothetical protein
MQLLIEQYTASEANIIAESVQDGKEVFLNGIFMQAEAKNRNGRIYPLKEMVSAVRTLNETIQTHGSVLGECDHPTARLSSELKYASHIITEVCMDGNNATGRMKLMNTPCGLIVKEVIKSGYRPGVSSRGAGNVGNDGVVEGFAIQTIDIVVVPSASGALPNTVYESLSEISQGRKVLTLAEAVMEDETAQKYFIKEIRTFLRQLTK